MGFAEAWAARVAQLLKRAHAGAKWEPLFVQMFTSPEAGAAAARWVGIESGGNPLAQSSLTERGLAQVSQQSLKELGLTPADFEAMRAFSTLTGRHADMAAKVMLGELVITAANNSLGPTPGWGPPIEGARFSDGSSESLGSAAKTQGIGIGKLRHGLPLLVRELRQQGLLRASISATIAAALKEFKPSARLASFAKGQHAVTGDATADLMLRFMASAAVVAHGEGAAELSL